MYLVIWLPALSLLVLRAMILAVKTAIVCVKSGQPLFDVIDTA
jgi:hypothetical protein